MSEFPVAVQFLDVLGKTTVPFLATGPVRGVNFNTIKIHDVLSTIVFQFYN